MSFLGEIKRRKVFQVGAVYAVVAWLAIQVITAIETTQAETHPLRAVDARSNMF
jgi:hypothetical protein